ncbi:MAG: peptidylprolyl isomerase [Gemmataceae bacterium]|nr:peptidylprolyl isomerase [Gemmataceae bacterium]
MCRTIVQGLLLGLFVLLGTSATAQDKGAPPKGAPTPTPPVSAAPPANAIAATVNGQHVMELAVYRALRAVPDAKKGEARPEILGFLIDNVLIDQHLRALNIPVDTKDVDARVDEMRTQLKRQNLDFDKVLKDMMLTADELRTHITAELRWEKYIATQATEPILRDVYAKNPDMFDGSMVHARHILLTAPANDAKANENAKAQLLAIRKQVEDEVAKGMAKVPPTADPAARDKEKAKITEDTFAAIAKGRSACPSKDQGGDIGMFQRTGHMVEPFARAAFALKPYEMSGVVTTQFGHHLILTTERRPGAEKKFEEVKDDVKDVYAGRLRESLIAQQRQSAKIQMTGN